MLVLRGLERPLGLRGLKRPCNASWCIMHHAAQCIMLYNTSCCTMHHAVQCIVLCNGSCHATHHAVQRHHANPTMPSCYTMPSCQCNNTIIPMQQHIMLCNAIMPMQQCHHTNTTTQQTLLGLRGLEWPVRKKNSKKLRTTPPWPPRP